jgi:hypothetical protein
MNDSSDMEPEVYYRKQPKSGGRTVKRRQKNLDEAILD